MVNEVLKIDVPFFSLGIIFLIFFLTTNCKRIEITSNIAANQQISPLPITTPDLTRIIKVTGKPCPKVWYAAEKENPRCVRLQGKLVESAAAAGEIEEIKQALEAGANIDIGYFEGYPALHQASAAGHVDAVNLLLDNGADVNRSLTFGNSPLLQAVVNQHPEVVRILLERGADVCPKGSDGPTLLRHAMWYEKNQEIVDLLKQAGGEKCKQ